MHNTHERSPSSTYWLSRLTDDILNIYDMYHTYDSYNLYDSYHRNDIFA